MKLFTAQRIIAGVLVLTAFYFTSSVMIPIVLALVISMLLDPLVVYLENHSIARKVGTPLVLFSFLILISLGGMGLYRTVYRMVDQAPVYAQHLDGWRIRATKNVKIFQNSTINERMWKIQEEIKSSSGLDLIFRTVGSVFGVISLGIFVPLLCFYLLVEKSNLVESFNTVSGKVFDLPKLNSDLPSMLRAFARGNLIGGIILCVLHAILFESMGLHGAWGIAFLSGILNLIPLIGVPLAFLLPFAEGLTVWSDPLSFLILFTFIVVFHFVVGNVVLPALVGSRVNVNTASLIAGFLFWGWLWGAMGFLLAIPLTAAVKIFLESNEETRVISNLLASKPRYILLKSSKTS